MVEAEYRVGLVARDKVREAEAALAEKQADLYSLKCQHAAPHATEGRAITGKVAGWWRRFVLEVRGAVSLS